MRKYVGQFRNVNQWFNNKPWQDLTREDIQRVYDDLEDGVITNRYGKPYRDRKSYYTKIFKAKPFKLAGKFDITEEVFEFFRPVDNSEVNYISFSDFKSLIPEQQHDNEALVVSFPYKNTLRYEGFYFFTHNDLWCCGYLAFLSLSLCSHARGLLFHRAHQTLNR